MKNSVFNNNVKDNAKNLASTTTGAVNEIKEARKSPMYFVNLLNKLYRKNEFVEGVSLHELGNMVRAKAKDLGHEVPTSTPFNLYLFSKGIGGQIGYTHTHKVKACGAYAIAETITDFKVVTLSEIGLVRAYKYILNIDARGADATCREAEKAARKAAKAADNEARKEARKSLKKQQSEARKAYTEGRMCAEEFAKIMALAV